MGLGVVVSVVGAAQDHGNFNFFMLKFINKYNTGKYNIRMTQNFIDRQKVNSIKKSMMSNEYNFDIDSNKIAYEMTNGIYYITEGHHRMQAALEIWKENGNYECVRNLIKNGLKWIIKKKPNSYRFIF